MDSMVKLVGRRLQGLRLERGRKVEEQWLASGHTVGQKRGLSGGELAEALGLSTSALRHMEQGLAPPGFSTLVSIAHYFRIDPFYMLIDPYGTPLHRMIEKTRGARKSVILAMDAAGEEALLKAGG